MPLPEVVSIADATGRSRATIAPERGAIVTSFNVGGRELLYLDQETLLDPTKNVRGGIPILFPSPGKLTDDRWQCDGKAGGLKQHGFARTRAWQVRSLTAASVTLQLHSDAATLAQYPWPFLATLQVTVSEARLRLAMQIENRGPTAMPFALGYHPYFVVTDKRHARIETDGTQAFDNVSKSVGAFRGFDLTANEVDLHVLDQTARQMPLTLADGSRIEVTASSEFAHWVVWTVAGKDYVCVEPWTSPGNALNSGERLLRLAPGETHRSFMEIAFQT